MQLLPTPLNDSCVFGQMGPGCSTSGPGAAGYEECWFWSLICYSQPAAPASSHFSGWPLSLHPHRNILDSGIRYELLHLPPTWTPSSGLCPGAGRHFQYTHLPMSPRGFPGSKLFWVCRGPSNLSITFSPLPAHPLSHHTWAHGTTSHPLRHLWCLFVLHGMPFHFVLLPNSY